MTAVPERYTQARSAFRAAAQRRGAQLISRALPEASGLFVDAALTAGSEPVALVTISGTHGVEGYCGSAVQQAWLAQGRSSAAWQLHIHAMNPWGMAWASRTDRAFIDVNRNFVDHGSPPANPAYALLHEHLPKPGQAPSADRVTQLQQAYVREHGLSAWNRAFAGGQYAFPAGVSFGGQQPSFSAKVLELLLARLPAGLERCVVVDLHCGVGPYGRALLLESGSAGAGVEAALVRQSSHSIRVGDKMPLSPEQFGGLLIQGCRARLSAQTLGLIVEYGTLPAPQMLEAVLLDRWYRLRGRGASAQEREALLERYIPTDPAWISAVRAHGTELIAELCQGLCEHA